jgi:hypothetical protein
MKRLLLVLLLAGCTATAPAPPPVAPSPFANAVPVDAAVIRDIETRLMNVNVGTLRYYVETTGSVTLLGRGTTLWRSDLLRFDVSGSIAGEEKSRRYEPEPIPPNGKRAIIEGLVRMGLAHNIYRLMNGQTLEGEAEGLTGVEAVNVRHLEAERAYLFDIEVNGARIGEARLWLQEDGRPARREQTVHFPGGDMQVVENYKWIM